MGEASRFCNIHSPVIFFFLFIVLYLTISRGSEMPSTTREQRKQLGLFTVVLSIVTVYIVFATGVWWFGEMGEQVFRSLNQPVGLLSGQSKSMKGKMGIR
ncbi:hypothetical protein GGS20DRAFT_329710 [Poronia punctata]|nr:hypothetical protein GGS20DRAFT_329710 [Poronia punctata]